MAKLSNTDLINLITSMDGIEEDVKVQLINALNEKKKYGLVWEDKPEDIENQLKEQLPVLTEVKERALTEGGEGAPNHILIEGDNLAALTVLSYTHEGKIDVIYIDPPYNRGKKDFIYNDNYVDAEDDYKHSKWLSFMEKRLKIAKRLLSEHGVIFISIGDDEECNLQLLCKEIFGDNNYIETYIWESTFRPDNSSPILRRNAEFVLCCAKDKSKISCFKGITSATSGMPSLTKAKEKRQVLRFPSNYVKTLLPDGIYKAGIKDNNGNLQWELKEDAIVKDGLFVTDLVLEGNSYWHTQKKILEEKENGTEIWIKSEAFVPYYKKAKDSENRPTKILPRDIVQDGLYGNSEMTDIFGKKVFDNPKPSTLISFLVNLTDNPNAIILDFFAGSGTTLNAVMSLNEQDFGHRQCFLATNNENHICEDVTYERNKRVIHGYTSAKGDYIEGFNNNNLRYYKTEFLPREFSNETKRGLMRAATDILCIKEGIYNEVREFGGMKFKPSILRYFKENDSRQMLLVFDERAIQHIVPLIEKTAGSFKVYVFSNGAYAYDDEFVSVRDRVELCALPEAILQVYNNVLPQNEKEVRI